MNIQIEKAENGYILTYGSMYEKYIFKELEELLKFVNNRLCNLFIAIGTNVELKIIKNQK